MQFEQDRRPIETRRRGSASVYVLLLATAGFLVARLPLLARRRFDPDEFEHAHAAWSVFKGMLPYRDFFEHHTPWYYYLLRPFFAWFAVDTSFENATRFLLFGRGLSLGLTILAVVLVFKIGRLLASRDVGYVAALFLVAQPVFFQKTLEMRPDVLALPFFLGGLWFLLRGLATDADATAQATTTHAHATTARLRHFFAAGLGVGAAIMCTQKMLFVLPGALVGLGIWALHAGREQENVRRRLLPIGVFVAGICVPAALTWAAFAVQGAGADFIANNFLLNAKWKHTPTNQLVTLIKTSAPVLALALLGAFLACKRFVRSPRRDHGDALLLCTMVGLFAGLLVVPVAHRQYYLMPLPIVCLFAAQGLLFLIDRARDRARASLLAAALVAAAVLPVLALAEAFGQRNDQQLARLRTVFDSTKPTDLVMDGWEGTGVFRPHAFHYFFLHEEAVAMLPPVRLNAYLDALESGKSRPTLIAMDDNLATLGPRFLTFVKRHYVSGDGFFYFSIDRFD